MAHDRGSGRVTGSVSSCFEISGWESGLGLGFDRVVRARAGGASVSHSPARAAITIIIINHINNIFIDPAAL